jgi:hypothetical protein
MTRRRAHDGFIAPRLRKPAAYALGGVLFAAAWLVRGGPLWWVSISALILTAAGVARLYRLGGRQARPPVSS